MDDRYLTIRKAAKLPDMPNEGTLRKMVKAKLIPGVYIGDWFYIDMAVARESLAEMARKNVRV